MYEICSVYLCKPSAKSILEIQIAATLLARFSHFNKVRSEIGDVGFVDISRVA